jgi:hypothetical protein
MPKIAKCALVPLAARRGFGEWVIDVSGLAMTSSDKDVQISPTLLLALEVAGGSEHLAEILNVSTTDLAKWLSGAEKAPHSVVRKAVELVFRDATSTLSKPERRTRH